MFRVAARMQTLLADEHPFTTPTRSRSIQAQARMGDLAGANTALSEISAKERETPWMRVSAAVIHLAEGGTEQALGVLAPVVEGSISARQLTVITEAQVLAASARDRQGDTRGAETSLERALELAEPDGIILPFVLAPAQALLERLPKHRTAHATLVRTVLDVLGGSSPRSRGEPAQLVEEISEAELRVIRYLPSNLKAPEIAAELRVSANTVRTHIRHIYAKLDAHERNEAVARARELGPLAPSARRR